MLWLLAGLKRPLIEERTADRAAFISTSGGRGIGLINKLRAYELQEQNGYAGSQSVSGICRSQREYYIGAQILKDLRSKDTAAFNQ
ncbi:MAG: hypothetical protein ACLU48_02060 [Clostridiaceae bacterium]